MTKIAIYWIFIRVFNSFNSIKTNYLNLEAWRKWYLQLVIDIPAPYSRFDRGVGKKTVIKGKKDERVNEINDLLQESVAIEVLNYRKNLIYYAESTQIRKEHFNSVKYRIGQVVKHSKFKMYGVIVGWDLKVNAPDEWVERNYQNDDREMLVEQPHYLILIDSTSDTEFQKAYVAQDQIEVIKQKPVSNTLINSFFSSFDGVRYIPKEYLSIIYPYD